MDVKIFDDYRLTSDTHCVIVNKRYFTDPTKSPKFDPAKDDSTPREKWREVAYYATVDQCLRYIADQRIRESDARTIEELRYDIRKINGEIRRFLNG